MSTIAAEIMDRNALVGVVQPQNGIKGIIDGTWGGVCTEVAGPSKREASGDKCSQVGVVSIRLTCGHHFGWDEGAGNIRPGRATSSRGRLGAETVAVGIYQKSHKLTNTITCECAVL